MLQESGEESGKPGANSGRKAGVVGISKGEKEDAACPYMQEKREGGDGI